jgi:hypothetical protein
MGNPTKIEDPSSYYGSLQIARVIRDYWLARGRKLEPQIRATRIISKNDGAKDVVVWGLSSPPLHNGLPPRIKDVKPIQGSW